MGGSRLAGRSQPGLIDLTVYEPREWGSEPLDLADELTSLGGEDSGRDSGWRRANLAVRALALAAVVGLTFGGGAALIWSLTNGGVTTGATRSAHGYLLDLQNARYAQAYDQLCAPQETLEAYSARLAQARSHGHRITSFRLDAAFRDQSTGTGSSSATGKVSFADGTVRNVTFGIEPGSPAGPSCIDTDDTDLGG